MYSLGILFFEMCHKPIEGMEKQIIMDNLRLPEISMPPEIILTEESVEFLPE